MVGVRKFGGDTLSNVKGSIKDCFEHFKQYLKFHTPCRQCGWRCCSHCGHEVMLEKESVSFTCSRFHYLDLSTWPLHFQEK